VVREKNPTRFQDKPLAPQYFYFADPLWFWVCGYICACARRWDQLPERLGSWSRFFYD
jgi:hypothetical protein